MPMNALIGPRDRETGRSVKFLTWTVDSFDVDLVRLKLVFQLREKQVVNESFGRCLFYYDSFLQAEYR